LGATNVNSSCCGSCAVSFLSSAISAQETATTAVGVETFSGGTLTIPPGVAKVIRVKPGVQTVIIGDPTIVDASVLNENTIAVTAKGAGSTNLILLDAKTQQIMQATVDVRPASGRVIQVYMGDQAQGYTCAPGCKADEKPILPNERTTTYTTRDAQGKVISTSSATTNIPTPTLGGGPAAPPAQ
jgi:hypothetical protein